MTDPVAFIHKIWEVQKTDGSAYGVHSKKDWDTGRWQDYPTQNIGEVDLLDQRDNYFCPNLFSKPHRQKDYFLKSRLLYADCDEADPTQLDEELRPSLAWETSPGRWQAIWILDRPLRLDKHERLNQRLTYAIDADRGGWGATKVLRIPGTISTKYGSSRDKRFMVTIVDKGRKHRVEDLMVALPKLVAGRKPTLEKSLELKLEQLPDYGEVKAAYLGSLPRRAKRLLAAKGTVATEDRSRRLWELSNLLIQAGLPLPAVLVLVRESVWNKFRGRNAELRELQRDIVKAAEKHAETEEMTRAVAEAGRVERVKPQGGGQNGLKYPKSALERWAKYPSELPFLEYEEFMSMSFPAPKWLVKG